MKEKTESALQDNCRENVGYILSWRPGKTWVGVGLEQKKGENVSKTIASAKAFTW